MEQKNPTPINDSPFAAVMGGTAPAAAAAPDTEALSAPDYTEGLTDAELEAVNKYASELDITDSATALSYGAAAQKKIAEFSDSALEGVRVRDFGETGEMITNLLTELRGIDTEEKGGFLGIFRRTKNRIETMKLKYAKAEESVDGIVDALERHQITLLKDISVFDSLYDMNLSYLKELTMYIAAGKKRLTEERAGRLEELRAAAEASGKPEDAQAARDFADSLTRFERRLHDLELTRTVAVQTAPQIRLLQNNDTMMSEKIQTVIMNTVPLWKSQMVLALGIAHSADALEAQRSVTDMTNELLRRNASTLHQATTDIARESERGVVDIETLTETNRELIATLDEVKTIQSEAGERRREAELELHRIESELKNKLLEINKPYENKNDDKNEG